MTGGADITVLIPAWQADATIGRALASVERQTLRPQSILVIDDGSDPPLNVQHHGHVPLTLHRLAENRGSSAALNAGLALVTTPWVALLDADDEWLPEKLARQVPLMDEAELIATGLRFVDAEGHARLDVATEPLSRDAMLASLLEDCVIGKPTVLARTGTLRALGGFDESLAIGEDQQMWLRIAEHHRIALVPDVLVLAHDTPGSLSRRTDIAPDFLWRRVIQPIVLRNRSRISKPMQRRIIGARCQQAAQRCIATGHYCMGLGYLLRSMAAGHQLRRNLWFAITGAPPLVALKRWIRSL